MPDPFSLNGKVAIVTGASRGIGLAIAQAYARAGAKVALASRKQDALDEAAAAIRGHGGEAIGIAAHNGDKDALYALVDQTRSVISAGWTSWSTTRRPTRISAPCWKRLTVTGRRLSK